MALPFAQAAATGRLERVLPIDADLFSQTTPEIDIADSDPIWVLVSGEVMDMASSGEELAVAETLFGPPVAGTEHFDIFLAKGDDGPMAVEAAPAPHLAAPAILQALAVARPSDAPGLQALEPPESLPALVVDDRPPRVKPRGSRPPSSLPLSLDDAVWQQARHTEGEVQALAGRGPRLRRR